MFSCASSWHGHMTHSRGSCIDESRGEPSSLLHPARDTRGTPQGYQRDTRETPEGRQRGRQRDPRGTPEGRQGVHPTPWQCTLFHACNAKAARDTRGTPQARQRNARATPEGRQRNVRGTRRQRDARPEGRQARGTPKERQRKGTPEGREGVHPTQCTLFHTCNAKAARDTRGTPQRHQRDARGMPGRTSDPLAVHIVPRLPRKRSGVRWVSE